ncbi:hypothetical protein NVP1177O_52 [Vibrio phage 1.177.O._10N.286.45.E10]|nr:hypothetical protein NVP1177O_52 [Vibrio phage 1.177.O._10N.286.45.E10]
MIQVLVKSLLGFGTKMLMSLASEKLIEWVFFYLAEQIVKSSKTKHDDKFFAEIKRAYEGDKEVTQPKDY